MQELDFIGEKKKNHHGSFAKFWSEKYDFNWYKGISWKKEPELTKNNHKFQISKHFYDNFSK
jgi:hypothetical protein